MGQDFLSNIELYFSSTEIIDDLINIDGDENKHLTKVMRHNIGDVVYVTDGKGKIYKSELFNVSKAKSTSKIISTYNYKNSFSNIVFCIPILKVSDRFEFALEKSIEMGISNFIIFKAEKSLSKGSKLPRWNKIAASAMKQSLRSFLPQIKFVNSTKELLNLEGNKILFDQNFDFDIKGFAAELNERNDSDKQYFIFGPEGGLTEKEIQLFTNAQKLKLSENRLRSESAVVYAASILNSFIKS